MNISRNWLKEFVDIEATDREYDEIMTIAGQKVETTTRLDETIRNVKVGRVLSIVRHENSDHMWVCQIDVGEAEPVQIVTGAQNVRQGDLVPAALHNSWLAGGTHITKGKLRGVASNGMLCSIQELGLTKNDFPDACDDGIWILNDEGAEVGQDINEVMGTNDSVVEFEITNNRPDCYSLIGLARETAAAFNVPLRLHEPVVKGGGPGVLTELLDVETPDPDLCRRYSARMIRNVKVAPSPKWMRQRLRAAGIRPINNIVDITNYVMVEYGQPMHAFDYRYVKGGKIIVRRAGEDRSLTTLDGVERRLKPEMLVIADETRPVGLAGVMGGENSEIVADTTDVVFESANFDGTSIRKTALALGMRTDASSKYEKNIDPMLTLPAVNRACELVELLGAGEVVDGVIDILNEIPEPVVLPLEPEKINRLLGTDISEAQMIEYLRREQIEVADGMIQVPSWRPDLRRTADVAEEVARFYGYNDIPTTLMRGETTRGGYSEAQRLENLAGAAARAMGYSEIITYSFVSPMGLDKIRVPADDPRRNQLRILNPLGEDTSVMRTTALPSMLDILARNAAHHNKSAKLYEIAKVYFPVAGEELPCEPKHLMLGGYGEGDFFTLKGAIEAILKAINARQPSFEAVTDDPSWHPGRCAAVLVDGKRIGLFGQVHPLVSAAYEIDGAVYAAELDFTELLTVLDGDKTFKPLPKFPATSRDLAVVCDEKVTVGALETCIARVGGKLLRSVSLFDVYRGVGILPGKKSVAFSLVFRADERTLTDSDIEPAMEKILAALDRELGAIRR